MRTIIRRFSTNYQLLFLPVIERSTPADEINACLKSSYLWKNIKKLQLKTNMRVHLMEDRIAENFSKQLLDLGNGKFTNESNEIELSLKIGSPIIILRKFKPTKTLQWYESSYQKS